jgi:hypothetical protein
MPVEGINGILNVESAALHAPQVGVANTNPQHILSVGSNLYVSGDSTDVLTVDGNVVCEGVKVGLIEITPSYDLAAVANVGNVTSNTIQFTNATTSFVASSNVEIGGNITLTSNAQVKVGSNVLAEYTGPHGRDPTTPLLKKYPEILFEEGKFDGNDSTNTYTQAGYTVTASDDRDDRKAWEVFDGISDGVTLNAWQTNSIFNTSTGLPTSSTETYTDTLPGGTNHVGVTLKLQLPKAIQISRIFMSAFDNTGSDDRSPKEGVFLGSTNGTSWELIKSFTESDLNYVSYNGDESSKVEATITGITNTSYYSYIVLIVKKIQVPNLYGVLNIKEIKYYGYEEPAPPGDLSLDTTLKSTFNSVRSNNYVMYFDGEDPAAGNVPKYLPSGSVKSITPNNVVFDATNNYWTLDGSTESNVTTGSLGLVGDAPHTVSTWINASNLEANATTQQLFSIGSGYSEEIVRVDDTQIAANTWHNVTYAYQGEGGSKVTYVDGRKVEESQVEDTFGVYPPFPMTDFKTGGYRVSASSEYPNSEYLAWEAFDDDITDNSHAWISGNLLYNQTTGSYNGNVNLGAGVADNGEWIKIEMPHKLVLDYITICGDDNSGVNPKDWKIYGSNDDKNWDVLLSKTNVLVVGRTATSGKEHTVNATKAYKYFALVVTKSGGYNGGNHYIQVSELEFYGHKEGDLTRFPEPTRVLKYPHIAMTGPAQRGYVASASSDQSQYSLDLWKAFDGVKVSGNGWASQDGTYYDGTSPANSYTGTTHQLGTGTAYGEWLKLELPHKIKVTKFILYADPGVSYGTDEAPKSYKVYGSVSGSSWTEIKDVSNETPSTSGNSHDVTDTTAYKYLGIVVTQVNTNQDNIRIGELEYYGTEEDTGTPAIVGGPFAGKVANFRVYDQYLGDERIQEIYDAQKDAFGHKKSSMTFYKGRVGVGTTEPEGALTVVDERHAVAKFPARAVSADDSYVEGDGQIKLSAADGTGYQAFDGLTSTSWAATPTRNTRLSEEVDFGAWLKIQTPESMSLKKAEFESKPDWMQVGADLIGDVSTDQLGRSNDCSHDGTRIILSSYAYNSNQGRVRVYDWNGSAWTQVGNIVSDAAATNTPRFGRRVAISGDGNIIAIAAPHEHVGSDVDKGTVRVYHLVGATWTILPDSGSLTETEAGFVDAFVGSAANDRLGEGGVILSYDGKTLAIADKGNDTGGADRGQVRVYTYSDGAWSQKGLALSGTVDSQSFGAGVDMTEDGNHLIIGTASATSQVVKMYKWNGTDTWIQKGSDITYSGDGGFGRAVSISNDGNVIAIGMPNADLADGALADEGGIVRMYHYTESNWELNSTLVNQNTDTGDLFGMMVQLSGDGKRMIVSAGRDDDDRGKLYTFEYTGTSWKKKEPNSNFTATGVNPSDYLGYGATSWDQGVTLSRDGSVIVGGELGHDTATLNNAGRTRVWNMPSNIKSIWGSNDDVNWTKITTAPTREEATSNVAGLAFGYDDRLEFKNLDNPNYYKYHAIVADAFTQLKEVKLFGIRNQGSSTLHDGTLTLTKNLDVPRIGPPPDADDTPRRDRLVVEYNTSTNPLEDGMVKDTSGRGNDGVFVGTASYDTTQKAFTFPGTAGNYITRSQIGNSAGAWVHSFSLWVNTNDLSYNHIFSIGADSDNDTSTFRYDAGPGGNAFKWFFYGNDVNFTYSTAIDVWLHVVGVYDGGSVAGSRRLWVNGVESVQSSSSGIEALTLTANTQLTLGERSNRSGTQTLNGEISNFKLYDCALTAEEVKTLYNMGRTGSVANPQPLHIAAPMQVEKTLRIPVDNTDTDVYTAGMIRFNKNVGKIQVHNGSAWLTIGGVSATGGTVSRADGYTIHTFTSSGTFTVNSGGDMEYLVVAGGGGGGYDGGGGGGGGGVLTGTLTAVTPDSYTITRGGGGAAATEVGSKGGNGSNSTAFNLTALGGGGGGSKSASGNSGGSGGGGGHPSAAGGQGQPGQGSNGGSSSTTGGGGGGGAGGVGGNSVINTSSGNGGVGLQSGISGTNTYYAGGGGGGSYSHGGGSGGNGGGGRGGDNIENASQSGTPNTGGGGGADGIASGPGASVGGSGIVIIRYLS